MIIELSISQDLRRWLGIDPPKMTRKKTGVIGAHSITNTEERVSWQCHVIPGNNNQGPYHTVLAIQPVSSYALLIPYLNRPDQNQLAGDLVYRWGNELMHRMVDTGAIRRSDVQIVAEQFKASPRTIAWYLNSDASLMERANSTAQWITGYLSAFELAYLEEDHAIDLGAHINSQSVTSTGMQEDDSSIIGFVNDGLYRFAQGLCTESYENTPDGHYPPPWEETLVRENRTVPIINVGGKITSLKHSLGQ